MTTSDLAGALAEQRAAYRPEHVPPFSVLVARKRRHDRRRYAAVGAALSVAVAGAALALPDLLNQPDTARSQVGTGTQAAAPEEQRLREPFSVLTPPVTFGSIDVLKAGPAGLGDQPRDQAQGLTATSTDAQVSVSWTVLTPALTDTEAVAIAGSVEGGNGVEQGRPLATGADQTGPIRSVAYRFDGGSFIRIWAWSTDGGVATVTSGAGATTTDEQVAALEQAARDLLA